MISNAERVLGFLPRSQSQKYQPDEVTVLNERRRIALEKIDNAHFSCDDTCLLPSFSFISPPAGTMPRYVSSQGSVSLPMRKSTH